MKIEVKLWFLMCSWELDYKSSIYHICTRKRWRFPVEFSFCNVQNISWKIMFQELVVWLLQLWLNIIDTWLLRNVEVIVAIYVGY